MCFRRGLIVLAIVALGALVLSPAIAWLQIDPLPGDINFNWQEHRLFLPFAQSLIASVALGLLFLWAKK